MAMRCAAVLVLAEAWYPGWNVWINGAPAAPFPVNGWMRGARVPAGRVEVEWRYQQRWIVSGLLASLLAAGLLAGWSLLPSFNPARSEARPD